MVTNETETPSAGSLSVLNCGSGDMKFSFSKDNPVEVDRARRVVEDMLRRGYVLFVQDDNRNLRRVSGFDPATDTYILTDVPGQADAPQPPAAATEGAAACSRCGGECGKNGRCYACNPARRKSGGERVPAKEVNAIGFAPTAGG